MFRYNWVMPLKSNIANILTLIRIACIPLMVFVFFSSLENARPLSAIIFMIAALTDWLDGWVAREFDQSSKLGAFLDPVADKLIVCIALLIIVQSDPSIINTLVAIVIVGREISISALREWMAEQGKRGSVAVSQLGKIKTAAQMLSIMGLTWQFDTWMTYLSYACLYLATVLTLWSMVQYLQAAWSDLSKKAG